jgi:hypothetical protein
MDDSKEKAEGPVEESREFETVRQSPSVSPRRVEANRRNAQRSTGPRTAEGKARVAKNPLKHGLTGRQVILPDEHPDEFDAFRDALIYDLAPEGQLQVFLAEKIVSDAWRLRRIPRFQAALYRRANWQAEVDTLRNEVAHYEKTEDQRIAQHLRGTPTVASEEREAHDRAKTKLERFNQEHPEPAIFQTLSGMERNSELLDKLDRYETTLFRSLSKALHEIERLKAAAAGAPVAPPIAVDVNISGDDRA